MLVTSAFFGAHHLQQHIFAVITAVMGGLYWTILFKKFNNLRIAIYSHALFDTMTLMLIYAGQFELFPF